MENNKSVFEFLSSINCNQHTEKKNGLTYLSWAWAWGITKKHYPDANYQVKEYEGKPYLFDPNLGYLVTTEVKINGETIPMSLPVMDNMNRAMKNAVYQLRGKDVAPATMFDINTAIMRCLTKNLAMFGLGHYIYAGEDLPQLESEFSLDEIKNTIEKIKSLDDLNDYYTAIGKPKDTNILSLFTKKKTQLV
jgi:hypothetical protein